jgi:hypothetical protein
MRMMKQSYQEVTSEVLRELPNLKGVYQEFFYNLKQQQPKRFERLVYDTNGRPFSSDLESVMFDLHISGLYPFSKYKK